MTARLGSNIDILDQHDPLRRPMLGALGLHGGVVLAMLVSSYVGHRDTLGAPDAGGGAIGIEAVKSLPLPHRGMPNPVANDTDSEVPQTPVKEKEQVKKQRDDPNAIKLKDRTKKKEADRTAAKQKFRPFDQLDSNQLTSKQAPQVSNPLFQQMAGAGRIGTGANTPLGNRFPAYAQQIQQLISQKWRTGDIDASIRTAPMVIATFDLTRTGEARNIVLLQKSGIPSLDSSVQRAILEASPFPPIPIGFDRDTAKVEFWFELKR
jgi:TonB family protein